MENLLPDPKSIFGLMWSINRHQLIADAAEKMLTPETLMRVKAILDPIEESTLFEIAGWADNMKRHHPNPETDDKDTIDFLGDVRNKNHGNWHFVNLPFNAEKYDRDLYPEFTREDDVVQIIILCIQVLTGKSERFTNLNALRLLVHLVGDVHQPLHVGCSYIRDHEEKKVIIGDPDLAKGLPSDKGGNSLLLPIGAGIKMHEYWDGKLGGGLIPGSGIRDGQKTSHYEILDRLHKEVSVITNSVTNNHGSALISLKLIFPMAASILDLPIAWASETLLAAKEAYQSLTIIEQVSGSYKIAWEGKEEYDKRCTPIVQERITSAAHNLASLLNTIFSFRQRKLLHGFVEEVSENGIKLQKIIAAYALTDYTKIDLEEQIADVYVAKEFKLNFCDDILDCWGNLDSTSLINEMFESLKTGQDILDFIEL